MMAVDIHFAFVAVSTIEAAGVSQQSEFFSAFSMTLGGEGAAGKLRDRIQVMSNADGSDHLKVPVKGGFASTQTISKAPCTVKKDANVHLQAISTTVRCSVKGDLSTRKQF